MVASLYQESRSAPIDYCDIFDRASDVPLLYHCKVCGKTVSNRWHHAAIHRPQINRCPLCQQTFTRKDNMKVHIRIKHGPLVAEVLSDSQIITRGVEYV